MDYIMIDNRYFNVNQIVCVRVLNASVEVFTSGGQEYIYADKDKDLFMAQFKAVTGGAPEPERPTEITVREFVEQNYEAKIDAGECKVSWKESSIYTRNIYEARLTSLGEAVIYWCYGHKSIDLDTLLQVTWLK